MVLLVDLARCVSF
nr:hypothetical protein [Escherichia coli]